MSTRIGGSARGGEPDARDTGAELKQAFRAALGHWASGVTVVSVRDEPNVFGTTVTAFTSVSLEPPLVLVGLGPNAVVRPLLETGSQLVVNILSTEQQRTATIFTDTGPLGRELFPPDGPPVLEGSLASLVCTVDALHPAGDHLVVIARVHDVRMGGGGAPLIRYDRTWRALESVTSTQ